MLMEVPGKFVKFVWAEDSRVHLTRQVPDRPPARPLHHPVCFFKPKSVIQIITARSDVNNASVRMMRMSFL